MAFHRLCSLAYFYRHQMVKFRSSYNRHKMSFRSAPCIFLGYSPSHHGYRCFDRHTGRIYIARHVRFDEHTFPFSGSSILGPPPAVSTPAPWAVVQHNLPAPSLPTIPLSSQSPTHHAPLSPSSITSPNTSPNKSRENSPPTPPLSPDSNSNSLIPSSPSTRNLNQAPRGIKLVVDLKDSLMYSSPTKP